MKKNVPFRDAHQISGLLVKYCIEKETVLDELTIEEYKKYSELFEEDIYSFIDIKNSVEIRKVIGGPNKDAVSKVIKINEDWIKDYE